MAQGQNSRVGSLPCTDGLQSGELEKGESRDPSKVPALQCVVAASTDREHYATANGFYASQHLQIWGRGVSHVRLEQPFAIVPESLIFSSLSDRAIRMWMVLARIARQSDACMPTRVRLSEMMSCSIDSVDRAARELSAAGWVTVESGQSEGAANAYVVRIDPVPPGTPQHNGHAHPATRTAPLRHPQRVSAGRSTEGAAETTRPGSAAPPTAPVRHPLPEICGTPSKMNSGSLDTGEINPPPPPTGGTPPADTLPGLAAAAAVTDLAMVREERQDRARRQRRRTQLPDPFELTAERRAAFAARGVGDVEHEFQQFCEYHRGNGSLKVDWDATWRTWVGNTRVYGKRASGSVGSPVYVPDRAIPVDTRI